MPASSSDCEGTSTMHDPLAFEARLGDALARYADQAPIMVEPAAMARAASLGLSARREPASSPTQLGRSTMAMLAAVALLIALVGTLIATGGAPRLPSIVAPDATVAPSPLPSISIAPSASPVPVLDGEAWIAYMEQIAGEGSDRIFLVRPDGSGRHQLETGLEGEQEHPDWSPDGARIAFDRWLPDTTYPEMDRLDLWTMAADGTDATLLLDCALPCLQLNSPAWSPDGRSIAYLRYDYLGDGVWGESAIEIVDVASGDRRVVARTPDGATALYGPRWSPDGAHLVATLETYEDASAAVFRSSELILVAADGVDPGTFALIDTDGMDAFTPDRHPTDERILFATTFGVQDPASRTVPTDIYSVRSDGSELTNLTDLGLGDRRAIQPTWIPDGSGIAFTQVDGFGTAQISAIALMDADGSGVTRLGFAGGTAPRLRPTP